MSKGNERILSPKTACYTILYIWKVFEKLVPNTSKKIRCYNNNPEVDFVKSQWHNKGDLGNFMTTVSVIMHGAKLFNILPKKLRRYGKPYAPII